LKKTASLRLINKIRKYKNKRQLNVVKKKGTKMRMMHSTR
jgi:hypothetical protein